MHFGERLRQERLRHHLSQEALAEALNLSSKSISRWERGLAFPQAHARLQLSRLFGVPPEELFTEWETQTSPPLIWSVPFPRNPYFTGREAILQTLHRQLAASHPVALTQALSGLGGVGKTQIALEYAYRYAMEYRALFWIEAETIERIVASMTRLADLLELPEREETDQQQIVTAVQRWLTTHRQWLLIWDNLEDLDLLRRFLPPSFQETILITTRRQALGTLARSIDLAPMEPEEGLLFLLRRARVLGPEAAGEQVHQFAQQHPAEYVAAEELVRATGRLPLALDQAGAYLEETGGSISGYVRRYEHQSHQLLHRRGAVSTDHPLSVVATLELACQWATQRHPAALELVRFCAFVSPDAIPEELFVAGASHLGSMLGPVAADPDQFDLALAALRSVSLVKRHAEAQTLSIHRLVQVVLREGISEQEQEQWMKQVAAALNAAFPEATYDVWKQCERLLPHVLLLASTMPDQRADREFAAVLRKAADYLRQRARYEQAERLYERALHIQERLLGAEHPEVATSLYGLARLYEENQGNYTQAESFHKRALHIREQALGLEHPDLTASLNSLAVLYALQAKYEQAEPLFQRALSVREQALGSEHPRVCIPLGNLALLYTRQGKYEQAEALYQRELWIKERSLGLEHPDLTASLGNLGNLYLDQGRDEQARPLYERALHIKEQMLGPMHPSIALACDNLADCYRKQGKGEQAESLYERALRIQEQVQGPEHPDLAHALSGLATLYDEQGKEKQAEPLYERALHIREQALGPDHPDTAKSLVALARLYENQGKEEQAESLLQRACSIFEERLGPDHPETVKARNAYSCLLE
ncbi:MAG: tetratricopeptide repeat protein [Ktedonobacteraceae bacterium]|nr:tetratricopeptide repeat protein [Ktedonobacteraceae bacterium]